MHVYLQNVLYTLGQLAQEFPEVSDVLSTRLQDADLRLPTKPPSKAPVRVTTNNPRVTGGGNRTMNTNEGPPTAGSQGSFVQPRTFGLGL